MSKASTTQIAFSPHARRFFFVTLFAIAVFIAVALASASQSDWPFASKRSIGDVENLTGPVGSLVAWGASATIGSVFAWLIPGALLALSFNSLRGGKTVLRRWVIKGAVVVVLLNAFFALTPLARAMTGMYGGLGETLSSSLRSVFGEIGTTIILVAATLLVSIGEFTHVGRVAGGGLKTMRSLIRRFGSVGDRARDYIAALRERAATRDVEWDEPTIHSPEPEVSAAAEVMDEWEGPVQAGRTPRDKPRAPVEIISASASPPKTGKKAPLRNKTGKPLEKAPLPQMTILNHIQEEGSTYSREELRNWSVILEEKLANYGVEGKVTSVHHGPVVTTFEFEPAPGVRIKEIVNRSDDLALAMRARSLRMIAPIPGRAAVGIEIPNPKSRTVYLQDVLHEVSEQQRSQGVMIALGVDVVGKPFVMNLCDAPHLLIAGTTGSGKSVCLNSVLSSILLQYRPADVRLVLVDPKMVEMSMYNGIPHLLHPVITEPKEACKVLEYMVGEMGRRNFMFKEQGVRNIESYNAKVAMGRIEGVEDPERLPYIVIVVDELGDLALAKGVDLETLLAKLAQMARAAGIHMVLATQRPSVDVIVGRTKANFPTRIAFRVATKVDSRTILDRMGAEKLLGRGDMLYMDALNPVPVRLHGAWVSEAEIEELIEHWKAYEFDESNLDLTSSLAGSAEIEHEVDPLFDDARGVVVRYKQGSTSLLQRKLHVGYARAARILDQLENHGIVGPPDGSKPREVYADNAASAMLDD